MSEHDDAQDAVDQLYRQAETLLSDAEAQRARRAHVLAAIEAEDLPNISPPHRKFRWRLGGVLTAAAISGFGLLWATQIYLPLFVAPPTIDRPPSAPKSSPPPRVPAASMQDQPTAPSRSSARPAPDQSARAASTRSRAIRTTPDAFPASPAFKSSTANGSTSASVSAGIAPPPPLALPPAPPAPPAPMPPAPAPPAPQPQVAAAPSYGAPAMRGETRLIEATAALGVRLREAAASGRTAEVRALLDAGAPIDEGDDEGETALMESIAGGHADTAGLLHRRGADLDRRSQRGVSARDLARGRGDAALNEALGISFVGGP